MNIDEMIAVLQAYKDGKVIQVKNRFDMGDKWGLTMLQPLWDFDKFVYRVKPEPREFWIALNSNGSVCVADTHELKNLGVERIKVREVIE